LYCDPQTSGGLLVACAADHADALFETIVTSGYPAARIIGEVTDGAPRVVLET
jgi:selenide,water dikinase